jgi:hypothetical protein
MGLIVLLILILLLFGGGGFYGYRPGYYGGRGFGGLLGLILIVVVYLVFRAACITRSTPNRGRFSVQLAEDPR